MSGRCVQFTGPLLLGLDFLFDRPAKHFHHFTVGGCKMRGRLRDDAPTYVTGTPDLDKLHRAVQDSLKTAGVVKDDSQFCRYHEPVKRYANPPDEWAGVRIRIWRL
jgi:Holliday junction resolvase RusA-like endonuclease